MVRSGRLRAEVPDSEVVILSDGQSVGLRWS